MEENVLLVIVTNRQMIAIERLANVFVQQKALLVISARNVTLTTTIIRIPLINYVIVSHFLLNFVSK